MSRIDSTHVVNIADLRLAAKRRLPRAVFDYIDGHALSTTIERHRIGERPSRPQ